jgi:hypothetical protein
MAWEGFQVTIPGTVQAADLSDYKYHAVYFSTNNTVSVVASTTAKVAGVLQEVFSTEVGGAVTVCSFGFTKMVAGATLIGGDTIKPSSIGHADKYTFAAADNGSYAFGQVIEGGDSSQYITAFVNCAVPMADKSTA